MEIREVKDLRRWHVKKSRVWQEGYHIWGRIVADKWIHKSQVAAEGVKGYYSLILHKKVTCRGLLAWVVITPPAILIGSYIVLVQKLDRLFGRAGVRGDYGVNMICLAECESSCNTPCCSIAMQVRQSVFST